MADITREHRLSLARAALRAAEANAQDLTKNSAYWKSQVEQEKKLIESLESEIQEAKQAPPLNGDGADDHD